MNRPQLEKQVQVVSSLVEGVSINATCRMNGVAKHAVLKLLEDLVCACAVHRHRHVRNLHDRKPRPCCGTSQLISLHLD